jgi:hypothetical protein
MVMAMVIVTVMDDGGCAAGAAVLMTGRGAVYLGSDPTRQDWRMAFVLWY